jgi:tetratricopeptide (TPR) repeat protein
MASLAKGRAVLAPMRTRQNAPLEVEICDLRLLRDMTVLLADEPDERRRLTAEAIERANRLRDRYPDRTDVLEAQAHAYFFAALAVPGSDALSFWTEAKRAYGQLLERVPDDPGHSRNLALTEKYIGTIHQIDKRMDLARASFEHALELDRRVLELRPNSRQTTIDLAIDLGNLAQILWLQDLPALAEAAALYRESLALREQAAALDPQDVFARQALGFNLIQLSDLSRQMGELAESSRYARRAIDVYESLAPGEFIARRGLAWILSGRAAAEAGRAEEACRAYRRAQPSFQKAASLPSERGMLSQTTTAFLAEALETCPP